MNRLRFLPRSPGISRLILAGDRRALLAPEIALPGRLAELRALMEACQGRYRDVVPVLALAGLRWGESASLQVGDRVSIPGPGLRLRRTVLASGGGGALYVDTLKNNRGRTVPLVLDLVPIVDHWSAGKAPDAWLFEAPHGGPLRERVNGTTKSGRTRVVSMDDETVAVLRQRKADQAAEQLKAGDS